MMRRPIHASARFLQCLLTLSMLTMAPDDLSAHAPGLSEASFTIGSQRIEGIVSLNWHDIDVLVPIDGNRDGVLTPAEFARWKGDLEALGETFYTVEYDGRPYPFDVQSVSMEASEEKDLVFALRADLGDLSEWAAFDIFFNAFDDLRFGHRHLLTVHASTGEVLLKDLLSHRRSSARTDAPAPPPEAISEEPPPPDTAAPPPARVHQQAALTKIGQFIAAIGTVILIAWLVLVKKPAGKRPARHSWRNI